MKSEDGERSGEEREQSEEGGAWIEAKKWTRKVSIFWNTFFR